ncbi:MAG TPA: hypothetical protein VGX23_09490 [Actinocrinis sp.]|nr:hypothetical protein [Actinocrinis sp.]
MAENQWEGPDPDAQEGAPAGPDHPSELSVPTDLPQPYPPTEPTALTESPQVAQPPQYAEPPQYVQPPQYSEPAQYAQPPQFAEPPTPLPPPLPLQAPIEPADRLRAAVVALLNLSGLGLGYVLLRRWWLAALCWIATGILLLAALPPDANGTPGTLIVLFLLVLVAAAVHGGLRALRTPTADLGRRPGLALGLSIALVAVSGGAAALYDHAQQDAVQQMLLGRLTQADDLMTSTATQSFDTARPTYESALAIYRDLLDHHRTSQAGQEVPAHLTTFYQTVATPFADDDYCAAIDPLTYLRSLPATVPAGDLGSLATWPDDRLATSLYQCGLSTLGTSGDDTTTTNLGLLLSTFPSSPQAAQVGQAVTAQIATATAALSGSDPCTAEATLSTISTQIDSLKTVNATVMTAITDDLHNAEQGVETGDFDCGVAQYAKGSFDAAQSTISNFTSSYPDDPNVALAGKYLIAIQIAQDDPDAGAVTPTMASGGSVSLEILNDSPDAVTVLYSGADTGSVSLGACGSCTVYPGDQNGQDTCSGSANYPHTTIHLPAGTTYFLNQDSGDDVSPSPVSAQHLSGGDGYTYCSYETSSFR